MDHKWLFKSKLTCRGSQADRKQQLQNRRALERDDMRNDQRGIRINIRNSPFASHNPNGGSNRFKQELKIKYRKILSNKNKQEEDLSHWRPPFVSTVSAGKFLDLPASTALSKRITKTKENAQKILISEKTLAQKKPEPPRLSKRNANRLDPNIGSKNNQFHDYVKKNGRNAGFSFVHSTVIKSSKNPKRKKPIHAVHHFAVSDEDDFGRISPLEGNIDDAQNPVTSTPSITISTDSTQNEPITQDERLVETETFYAPIPTISISQQIQSTNQVDNLQTLSPSQVYSQNEAEGSPSTAPGICKLETVNPNSSASLKYANILNDEIIRLEELTNKWELYKLEIPDLDDCVKMIDGTVGQTILLISTDFKQFHALIDICHVQNEDRPMVEQELESFWDALKSKIKNIDDRFSQLEKLRSNDWKDVNVNKIIKKKERPKKVNTKRKSLISSLRYLLERQRQQNLMEANSEEQASTSSPKTGQTHVKSRPIPTINHNSPFRVSTSSNICDTDVSEMTHELGDVQTNTSIAATIGTAKSSRKREKSIRFVEPRKSSESDVILVESDSNLNNPATPINSKISSRKYRNTPKISILNPNDTPQSNERHSSVRTLTPKLLFTPVRKKKTRSKPRRGIRALINE